LRSPSRLSKHQQWTRWRVTYERTTGGLPTCCSHRGPIWVKFLG